jgi:hypothetical protein
VNYYHECEINSLKTYYARTLFSCSITQINSYAKKSDITEYKGGRGQETGVAVWGGTVVGVAEGGRRCVGGGSRCGRGWEAVLQGVGAGVKIIQKSVCFPFFGPSKIMMYT